MNTCDDGVEDKATALGPNAFGPLTSCSRPAQSVGDRTPKSLGAILVVLAAAIASFSAAAAGTDNLGLSLRVSRSEVVYGQRLALSGRESGATAIRAVGVYSRPLGQRRMRWIATVRIGADRGWSVRVKPAIATLYEARAGSIVTPPLRVGVLPAVATRLLNNGLVWAHVAAGRTLAGRLAELEMATRTGWDTIEQARLDNRSDAVFRAPFSQGIAKMRVAISSSEAGHGFVGAASEPFVDRGLSVSLSAPSSSVGIGETIELSGSVSSGRSGQTLVVLALGHGTLSPMVVATVTTGAGGHWNTVVAPSIETSYEAGWDGIESNALPIRVRPRITMTRLESGRVEANVSPASGLVGRIVNLQRSIADGWTTVAERPLTPGGQAIFSAPVRVGSATLRVVLSLGAARAAGYLGAASQSLRYHARDIALAGYKVLSGQSVTLTGRVPAGAIGQHVTILARPYGGSGITETATVITGRGGRWSLLASPTVQTRYTVRWSGRERGLITVSVEPRVTVEELITGRILTHIATNRSLSRRAVRLQELTSSNRWSTISQAPLNRHNDALFAPLTHAGVRLLRISISADQTGAGLLGAASQRFLYHR